MSGTILSGTILSGFLYLDEYEYINVSAQLYYPHDTLTLHFLSKMPSIKYFVPFILALIVEEIFRSQVEAHSGYSQHHTKWHKSSKRTTTSKTTTPKVRTTTTLMPGCNYHECEAKSNQFCLCSKSNQSTHWPIPKTDPPSCPSIGCILAGRECRCGIDEQCGCEENLCNKTECESASLENGCYCYFGDKGLTTYELKRLPPSKRCSDLLREIGNNNGRYQCSRYVCGCDEYSDCRCKPPTNKNPPIPKQKHCVSDECKARSFEFCQCEYTNCS